LASRVGGRMLFTCRLEMGVCCDGGSWSRLDKMSRTAATSDGLPFFRISWLRGSGMMESCFGGGGGIVMRGVESNGVSSSGILGIRDGGKT